MRVLFTYLLLLLPVLGFAQIELTKEERQWIQKNPVVRFGYDPEWEPIEFLDVSGNYTGITADFLKIIEERTGLSFEPMEKASWSESLDALKAGDVLLLPALAKNPERETFMDFTDPYLSYPFVIVNKIDGDFIGSLDDLEGKKLVLPKGYFITSVIQEEYPELDLVLAKDVESALMYVSIGQADATIGNLGVMGYYLSNKGFQDLQIAADTEVDNIDIRIGVTKGEPILVSILDKAIGSISNQERSKIMQEWGTVRYEHGVDMKKVWTYVAIGIGAVLLIIGGIVFWNRTLKKEIGRRKEAEAQLKESFDQIQMQHLIIEERNREVMDSIRYAKRIQEAIMPTMSQFHAALPDSFVYYLPKDIVAGDFYWMVETDDKIFWAAADCTGHGVPGAMVSVVCSNALNRSVNEMHLTDPGKILDATRELVIQRFDQSENEVKDGMDISLCVLNKTTLELDWAGAHNPLWIFRKENGEVEDIKADKQPIGVFAHAKPFTTRTVQLGKGDILYTFSDGFADQFGGSKGKKLKSKKFREIILQIAGMTMQEQHDYLHKALEDWQGDFEQLDDVCVIGVRV